MASNQITVEDDFMQYLAKTHSSVCISEFRSYYSEIESFCKKVNILRQPLFQTTDSKTIFKVQQTIEQNKIFRATHKKQIKKIITAGRYYYIYVKEGHFIREAEADTHKEKNGTDELLSSPVSETDVKPELSYTEHDKYLLQKYPIAYKSLFNALRNSPDRAYSVESLHKTINCFARQSVIKEILDNASWAKPVDNGYVFSSDNSRTFEIEQSEIYRTDLVKKSVPLYRTLSKENINAKEDSHEVSTQQESVAKEKNPSSESVPKYETPPVNTPDKTNASLADEETLYDKLYVTLKEESKVNKYGTTLMYLAAKVGASEKFVKAILASAEWAKLEYGRYSFSENANAGKTEYDFDFPMYFAASAPAQLEAERTKIYQKLYSISRVYDDPTGLSVDRIMATLGSGVEECIVREILDDASWAAKLSDDVYSFANKTTSVARESVTPYVATSGYITDTAFYKYLNEQVGMADATCRSYVSAIKTAEYYAQDNRYVPGKLYGCSPSEAAELMQKLLNDSGFMEFNTRQHNRFKAAFTKFSEMVGQSASNGRITAYTPAAQPKIQPEDFDKEKFEEVLLRRYRNGMQFDSIDFENFREMYDMLFDKELTFDDVALEKRLRYCGVIYKDRLFPAEGIIDSKTKEKLFSYIDNSFASGKKVIYYKAIYEDLSDVFAGCFTLTDENMLKAYIEYSAEKGKYYFFSNYMSAEKHVTIDHNAEVEEFLLNAGKPMPVDDVCTALSHIPQDQVNRIISIDSRFLRNAKGEYFHVGIFEISDEELDRIAEIINKFIDENEYAIWTDIWNEIQDKMPVFLENNPDLSWLGVRNAIAQRYIGRFNFEGAVISLPKDRFAMRDVYQLYAKHHTEFTADDIYNLSKELDTVIYFDALAAISVRVSNDLFVSKKQISFDVEAVDRAIGSFMAKDYIRIREIDSFLVFPNVGFEWNEYLLESFVASYSRKFVLLSNGYSLNNVAGAIVKKDGKIKEFVDVCAAALADSGISLKKTEALNYLADVNLITKRSYRDLDSAIRKATQIRGRKE